MRLKSWPDPLLPFVVTRGALLIACAVGLWLEPAEVNRPGYWQWFPHCPLIDGWMRWDSGVYFHLSIRGYYFDDAMGQNLSFAPGYALLVRLLSLPLTALARPEQAFGIAGLIVSHACFFVGLVVVRKIGEELYDAAVTRRALWLLCLYPFSFFFSAVYSESLFLAGAALALLLARQRRWPLACALTALVATVRIPGFVLILALAAEYLRQRQYRLARIGLDALWFALAPLGLMVQVGYLVWRFGPTLFARAHENANCSLANSWYTLHELLFSRTMAPLERLLMWWQLVLLVVSLWMVVLALRRDLPLGLFALGSMVVFYQCSLVSSGRYLAVLFPLFLAGGARLKSATAMIPVYVFFGTYQLYFLYQFSHWAHVT